jgi:hypothetical protein
MCVSKHSSGMNPLVPSQVENALILRNFTISVFTTDFPSSGTPTSVVLSDTGSRCRCTKMKNPGVFSSGVLVRYTNIVYQNSGSPGILFAEPLANSQADAWWDMGFVIEQNCCFIIVPIIVYLSFVVKPRMENNSNHMVIGVPHNKSVLTFTRSTNW